MRTRRSGALAALALLAVVPGCATAKKAAANACAKTTLPTIPLTVSTKAGPRAFCVELAKTPAQQERGLMFRTDLTPDGGMLFAPYPGDGGPPRDASFWMKNTPTPLDIIFIRADGTIARIADNTTPFDETPVVSGEPVTAVLELIGGRAAALGIAEGDRVRWTK